MKRQRFISCVLLIIVAVVPWLAAQVEDSPGSAERELTVEELYLKSVEFQLIREQAASNDRDLKIFALTNVREMMSEGRLGKGDPAAHAILDFLSTEGTGREVREGGNRVVNNFPEIRRQSAELLGKIGGENSKRSLLDILKYDREPMVLAEAAYGLGRIGNNEKGFVAQALANVIYLQDPVTPDNNLAFATLLAFKKIAAANNGIKDPYVFEAIVKIAQGNYIRNVKMKAFEVMDELKAYK